MLFQSLSYFSCGHRGNSARGTCRRRWRCGFGVLRQENQRIKRFNITRITRDILDVFPRIDMRWRIGFCDPEDKNCGGENVVRLCALVCHHPLGVIPRANCVAPANGELTREQNVNRLWSFSLGKQLIDLRSGSR